MTTTLPSRQPLEPSSAPVSLGATELIVDGPDSVRRSFVIMLLGCALVTLSAAWFGSWDRGTAMPSAPCGTINPNQAPWYELALLPRIGEAKARAIVAHRRTAAEGEPVTVFKVAGDLQQVSGIGPKTVQRLSSELRFDDYPAFGATPVPTP